MLETPVDDDAASRVEHAKNRLFALHFGAGVLSVLVLTFYLTGDIELAAAGSWGAALVLSLLLGAMLTTDWRERFIALVAFVRQIDKQTAYRRLDARIAELPEWLTAKIRKPESPSRLDTFGLWPSFILTLLGVESLIYLSGGVASSPFSAIPALMFTMVVLLVEVPRSEDDDGTLAEGVPPAELAPVAASSGEDGFIELRDGSPGEDALAELLAAALPESDGPWLTQTPFRILVAVAFVFYASLIALDSWVPWEVHHAGKWTFMVVTVMTVVVAIPLAVYGRNSAAKTAKLAKYELG